VKVRLTCEGLKRTDIDALNHWANNRVSAGEGGGMEMVGVAMGLADAIEVPSDMTCIFKPGNDALLLRPMIGIGHRIHLSNTGWRHLNGALSCGSGGEG